MTPDAIASIFAAEIDGLAPLLDLEVQWPAARLRERVFIGDAEWPAPLATSAYDRAALDRTQLEVGSRLTPVRDALVSLPDREALLLRAAIERRRSA